MKARLRTALPILVLAWILGSPPPALAHPLQFGVLHAVEHRDGRVEVSLRFSGSEAEPTGVGVRLPEGCTRVGAPVRAPLTYGESLHASIECEPEGLEGATFGLEGMEGRQAQVAVRVERPDGVTHTGTLSAEHPTYSVPTGAEDTSTFRAHVALGVRHILEGVDHLLFVLGLLLLVGVPSSPPPPRAPDARPRGRLARLVATITAFTLGHSLTLALASLGLARVPQRPVEMAIALSILLLAFELSRPPSRPPSWTARYPAAVAGLFGLLHGLGFAGVLREVGLPRDALLPALFGFNLGVEIGQLLFVAVAGGGMALAGRWGAGGARWPRRITIYAMGTLSVFFLLARL